MDQGGGYVRVIFNAVVEASGGKGRVSFGHVFQARKSGASSCRKCVVKILR